MISYRAMVSSKPGLLPRVMSGPMTLWQPESELMSMTPVNTESSADAQGPDQSNGHVASRAILTWLATGTMVMFGRDAAKCHVWVNGPAIAGVYDDVHDQC